MRKNWKKFQSIFRKFLQKCTNRNWSSFVEHSLSTRKKVPHTQPFSLGQKVCYRIASVCKRTQRDPFFTCWLIFWSSLTILRYLLHLRMAILKVAVRRRRHFGLSPRGLRVSWSIPWAIWNKVSVLALPWYSGVLCPPDGDKRGDELEWISNCNFGFWRGESVSWNAPLWLFGCRSLLFESNSSCFIQMWRSGLSPWLLWERLRGVLLSG